MSGNNVTIRKTGRGSISVFNMAYKLTARTTLKSLKICGYWLLSNVGCMNSATGVQVTAEMTSPFYFQSRLLPAFRLIYFLPISYRLKVV